MSTRDGDQQRRSDLPLTIAPVVDTFWSMTGTDDMVLGLAAIHAARAGKQLHMWFGGRWRKISGPAMLAAAADFVRTRPEIFGVTR